MAFVSHSGSQDIFMGIKRAYCHKMLQVTKVLRLEQQKSFSVCQQTLPQLG
jgi:hypothetical protein